MKMPLLLLHENKMELVISRFLEYRTGFFFSCETTHFNFTYQNIFTKIKAKEIACWTCTSFIKPAGDAVNLAVSNSLSGELT